MLIKKYDWFLNKFKIAIVLGTLFMVTKYIDNSHGDETKLH